MERSKQSVRLITAAIVFLLALPTYFNYLSFVQAQQISGERQFLLGFSGALCTVNHFYIGKLEVVDTGNRFAVESIQNQLDDWWGIVDKQGLYNTVTSLALDGHRSGFELQAREIAHIPQIQFPVVFNQFRQNEEAAFKLFLAFRYNNMFVNDGLLSWDFTRIVYLIRTAYTAGYISEDEAWQMLEALNIPERMKARYNSWQDSSNHYLLGRNFWSLSQTKRSGNNIDFADMLLSEIKHSPWNVYPEFEYNGETIPDYHQDDIEIPSPQINIPEDTINDINDYPEAISVSNTSELRQALSDSQKGDTIFLKSGLYGIGHSFDIREGVTIIGQQRDKVIFAMRGMVPMISIRGSNIVIDSVTFTVSDRPIPIFEERGFKQILVSVKAAGNVIRNCKFVNSNDNALSISHQGQLLVENCIFADNKRHILVRCSEAKLTLNNSLFENASSEAIGIIAAKLIRIEGNTIKNSKGAGIFADGQIEGKITNNLIQSNEGNGILIFRNESPIEITANICIDNRKSGIAVLESANTIVKDNITALNGEDGITLAGTNQAQLIGNRAYRNRRCGISAAGKAITASNNICIRNRNVGIYFSSTQGSITANTANENTQPGIVIDLSSEVDVEENTTKRNMFSGIAVRSGAKANLKRNISSDNYWAGLEVQGAKTTVSISENSFINNGAWAVVCLDGAKDIETKADVFEGNYRGNDIEVKTPAPNYLSRFKEFAAKN